METEELVAEFKRQVNTLLQLNYPHLLGISQDQFIESLDKLQEKIPNLKVPEINLEFGLLPFVIVINSDSLPAEEMMSLTTKNGKNGATILRPHTSRAFTVINTVHIPNAFAYLLVNIDRGRENINLPPNEAIQLIYEAKRSPLTINEGIAIITHFPDFLIKNNCFSLPASRTGKDQRVPAIWINAKKEPNLGWCWDGNPHTWLGSASCLQRID